jgi:hypothetical protein
MLSNKMEELRLYQKNQINNHQDDTMDHVGIPIVGALYALVV